MIIDVNDIEGLKKGAEKLGVNWFALLQAIKRADRKFLAHKNEVLVKINELEPYLNEEALKAEYDEFIEKLKRDFCRGVDYESFKKGKLDKMQGYKDSISEQYHYRMQLEAIEELKNNKDCFDSYGDDFVSEVKKNIRYKVNILEAKEQMQEFLKSSYGDSYVWRDSYDRVAEWLSDSNNRGLFMFGNCGTGKTVMCKIILRLVRMQYSDYNSQWCKMYDSVSNLSSEEKVNQIIGDIKGKRNVLTIIDDFGKESLLNNYGNKRETFSDIVDVADRFGTLLVASTNLDVDTLKARYGDRTIDRLKGMCRFVYFSGDSFRKLEGESL